MTPQDYLKSIGRNEIESLLTGRKTGEYLVTVDQLQAFADLNTPTNIDIVELRKEAFRAGWMACEGHFDPNCEIGGAPLQISADYEEWQSTRDNLGKEDV